MRTQRRGISAVRWTSTSKRSRARLLRNKSDLRVRTLICTSLSASTSEELAAKARRAFAQGSDLVEFRLDHLRSPGASEVAKDLSPFSERAVFTVRRKDEGGGFGGEESERLALIRRAAEAGPAYFDIELRTLEANPELARTRLGDRQIVSWHALAGTPSRARLSSLLARAQSYGGLAKIVAVASRAADNLAVLSLYDIQGPAPIAFCKGQAGVFSRVIAIERGTPLAYASFDGEATAEGQLPLGMMLAIRRRLEAA